jgi:predicted RNase H-like nuclease
MKLHNDKELINILSVKHRLNPEVIDKIINHGLKSIKECMMLDDMPGILIHNLGRFKPSKSSLDRKFRVMHAFVEKDPNNSDKVDWNDMQRYLKVYDRILKEENKVESNAAIKMRELVKSKIENKNE